MVQVVGIIKDIDANLVEKNFQIDYTYRACKPGIKEQIVYLAMNNAVIRDTARSLHISINAVVRAFLKKTFSPSLDKLKIVLICEVDEMWSCNGQEATTLVVVCMENTPKSYHSPCLRR